MRVGLVVPKPIGRRGFRASPPPRLHRGQHPASVGAIGQQDDNIGNRIRGRRLDRVEVRLGQGELLLAGRIGNLIRCHRRDLGVDAGDGVDRAQDGRADRRAPARWQGIEGGFELIAIGARGRDHFGIAGEGDQTDPGLRILFATNSRKAFLAAEKRLGSTSIEHIERETSSATMMEVRFFGTWPRSLAGGTDRQRGQAEQDGDQGQMSSPRAFALAECRPHQGDIRMPDRGSPEATLTPDIKPENQGQDQQHRQRQRPAETHADTTRPVRTTETVTPRPRMSNDSRVI
jgi:hypothetical protein